MRVIGFMIHWVVNGTGGNGWFLDWRVGFVGFFLLWAFLGGNE